MVCSRHSEKSKWQRKRRGFGPTTGAANFFNFFNSVMDASEEDGAQCSYSKLKNKHNRGFAKKRGGRGKKGASKEREGERVKGDREGGLKRRRFINSIKS